MRQLLEMKRKHQEEISNAKYCLAVFFFLILMSLVWIIDLENQNTALMSKVSSMRIQVAKCNTP